MRYIRHRMKDKSRTDIELTPLKTGIEAVFSENNIDDDCDTIASLLSPYRKKICEALSQGNYSEEPSCSKSSKVSSTILWWTSITIISMICTVPIMSAKTWWRQSFVLSKAGNSQR